MALENNEVLGNLKQQLEEVTKQLNNLTETRIKLLGAVDVLEQIEDSKNETEEATETEEVTEPPESLVKGDYDKGLKAYYNKDYKTAINEWLPLANENPGDARAQFYLGEIYRHARGLKDEKKSFDWYCRSSNQSDEMLLKENRQKGSKKGNE